MSEQPAPQDTGPGGEGDRAAPTPSSAAFQMTLRHVPARRGAVWLRQGFAVFFARPLAFAGLLGVVLFGMMVMMQIPWVGQLLMLANLPLVSLGFMLATHMALRGQVPTPVVFFEPLQVDRARRVALYQLGGLYALGVVLIMVLCHWLDGGKLMAAQIALAGVTDPTAANEALRTRLDDPQLRHGIAWRLGFNALLSCVFWHAPALVHWGGQKAAKSLFFSVVAMWRSKGAFLVYGLTGSALMLGCVFVCSTVLVALGQSPQSAGLVLFPLFLVLLNGFYASLFFTFADSFELRVAGAPAAEGPPAWDE